MNTTGLGVDIFRWVKHSVCQCLWQNDPTRVRLYGWPCIMWVPTTHGHCNKDTDTVMYEYMLSN